jgi:hypothetical protein
MTIVNNLINNEYEYHRTIRRRRRRRRRRSE